MNSVDKNYEKCWWSDWKMSRNRTISMNSGKRHDDNITFKESYVEAIIRQKST